jgi:chromosome segregation and condensation protein ScpB
MDDLEIKPILESLLFLSGVPLRFETLLEVLPELDREAIREGIERIKTVPKGLNWWRWPEGTSLGQSRDGLNG